MRTIVYLYRWIIAVAVFSLIAALIFIGLLFFRPREIYVLVQPLCRALLKGIGVRVKLTGLENFNHRRPYLIICNHESLLDAFICPGYIPMFFVVLELSEHFVWPIWGGMIRKWGNIPIAKDHLSRALASLHVARERLRQGTSILIFPEGERTVSGVMREFKKGAFYLAKKARTDILPMAMHNLYRAKTRGDWRVRAENVSLSFGKPLLYQEYADLSIGELRDRVRGIVTELKKGPK